MSNVEYQDFEIEIGSEGVNGASPQYYAHVLRSPAGEASRSPIKFRFGDPGALARLRADLETAVLEPSSSIIGLASRGEQVLRDFGREIFRSIFEDTKAISNAYAASKAGNIRLKLRISSPDLASLPWEYLYEDDDVVSYLSLRVPLVRYLETGGLAGRMNVKGPLRILGMISDPARDGWPSLNVAKERERINKGTERLQREGRIDFQWVSGGTGKDLINKLNEDEWHIFHFIGHGGVEPRDAAGPRNVFDQSGFIVMVDEDGNPAKKFASDLAMMLTAARKSLRLVVLNCCESARVNVGEKFGNPAIGLMQSGWLPAVVAMQFPISDRAAISMSDGFYSALARNRPVDEAVKNARLFIKMDSQVEFGIPVLYMRSADGKIFDVDNPVAEPSAANANAQSSPQDLQKRREEFLSVAEPPPGTIEGLEQLAQRGQDLIAHLKSDTDLVKAVAKLYLALGSMQQKLKQIPKAAASFASAIKLDPTNPEFHVRRANFNLLVGFFENALADIDEAIRLRPDNAEYYWIKGVICGTASGPQNRRGFLEQAVGAFSVAIGIKPSVPKYLASRANVYTQLGSVAEAIKDLERAIEISPEDADLLARWARLQADAVPSSG